MLRRQENGQALTLEPLSAGALCESVNHRDCRCKAAIQAQRAQPDPKP